VAKPLILGHRGFSAGYPENTRLAMVKAMEAGAHGVEWDVQLSRDGQVMVMHDERVDRTTDGHGLLRQLTYAELRRLNAAGGALERSFEPVPMLSEVLDDLYQIQPDGFYNLEIKVADDRWQALVDKTLAVVQNHPLRPRLRYSSFHASSLSYLACQDPTAGVGLLVDGVDDGVWQTLHRGRWASLHVRYSAVDAPLVARCHHLGLALAVYTVDACEDLVRMANLGVDIIISNRVDVALEAISGC